MGPTLHLDMTERWLIETGMDADFARDVAVNDACFDIVLPGGLSPINALRHLGPTARLWARRYLASAERTGSARDLGYGLHCLQDALSHGVLGMAHMRKRARMLKRDPDDWDSAPLRLKRALERETKRVARLYLAARGCGGHTA